MTYNHCLYPLPHLERFNSPSRSINIPKELRRTLSVLKPQIAWYRKRLWPVEGPHKLTKLEQKIESDIQWEIYHEEVKRERTAAKQACERMTIKEAWEILQSYLHTDQYDIEAMSEADWDIYLYAKDLIDQLIKLY